MFSYPGNPTMVEQADGGANHATDLGKSAILHGGWVKTGDSNKDVNDTLGSFIDPPGIKMFPQPQSAASV
jgi:hypothetical protein